MRTMLIVVGMVLLAGPLSGQVRQDPERLREQVVQRFIENYRMQAGLTDAQVERFRSSVRRQWEARRQAEQREREILQALGGELRPGVAADADSVTRLLDALESVQADRMGQLRSEQAEFREYLTPVQRAQLVLAFTRLERQIEELIRRRMEAGQQQMRRPN
ncbi:MAG TPA: hypothetical protein VGA02_01030 [Gemmatimonadales bacterium]